MKRDSLLRCLNLSFAYPQAKDKGFSPMTITLEPGNILGIFGQSGSGKSTFCLALAGIIPHHVPGTLQGRLWLLEEDASRLTLPQFASRIGLVFQDPETQLFCSSVEEEIAFGPENLCLPSEDIEQRVRWSLQRVGMERYRHHNPANLSGGEQQLIALAAVLALQPQVLILDETMSQLDQDNRRRVQSIMESLAQEGLGIILVDHDLENMGLAQTILNMGGDGHGLPLR